MKTITTIGFDIAKSVFQVHGAGAVVIRRQLKRRYVLAFFQKLSPCLVGVEACASSHYWSRELQALGHTVRLMPRAYVKPYVKRPHNPAGDNRWFQKNAPAVPRRRYSDFCNKICQIRTSQHNAGFDQVEEPLQQVATTAIPVAACSGRQPRSCESLRD
jgi:hypothetical protein